MATMTKIQLVAIETTAPHEYLITLEIGFEFGGAEYYCKVNKTILVPTEYVGLIDQMDHIMLSAIGELRDWTNAQLKDFAELVCVHI